MIKGWTLHDLPHGQVILPLDDIVVHTHTEICTCGPTIRLLGNTCTCEGWPGKLQVTKQIAHNAMDRREK